MPVMDDESLSRIKEPHRRIFASLCCPLSRSYGLVKSQPVDVISPTGLLRDKPGFAVDFIQRNSITDAPYSTDARDFDGGRRALASVF